jgi:glycosyltransferase involved in cell wall biosynthesis
MKITVLMSTYNHAAFIGQALESVAVQQLDREWELLVADDGSTDGTREIVRDFAGAHPKRVRLFFPEGNMGGSGNAIFVAALRLCDGDYVAFLDGDDYWVDAAKLQKQANVLDADPQLSGVFHRVRVDEDDGRRELFPHGAEGTYDFARLVAGNAIAWSSAMYRNPGYDSLPGWFASSSCIDWAFHLLHAQRGPIRMLDDVMSVYRRHAAGVWSGLAARDRIDALIDFTEQLPARFPAVSRRAVRRAVADHLIRLAAQQTAAGRYFDAMTSAWRALRSNPIDVAAPARILHRCLRNPTA